VSTRLQSYSPRNTKSLPSTVYNNQMDLAKACVVTTTLGYDNDRNLTSSGTSSFSWDYNNRMTQAVT
jgi:hypothetical protein